MESTPAKGQEQGPWVPPGPPPIIFEGFSTLNTNSTRIGIKDDECWWLDGFMPIGPNYARTMPGVGPSIFSAPVGGTISFFDFTNIGATPYLIAFHSDGGIWAVNTNTGAATRFAPDGTITNPARESIGITQWGAQYLIIVATQTNGYFIWDGTTFYQPGDTVPGETSPVPTGINGSSVETYSGHVWVSNGPQVTFSAPGSVTDFATSDGGGSFTSTDSFLRVQYTQLRQSNGFLYLIGDSSVNYISGVTTSGTPPTTTFTNQNADPEIGTPYPATVDVFSRNILFANAFGAHVSFGGAVTKISDALDGVYNSVPNFGGFLPSACKAIVFGKRIWALLLPVIDFITGQKVNKLFCFSSSGESQKWWSTQQDVNLIFVQHQEINSVITAYGTDGNNIYPLFQQPSVAFTKTIQSKLWAQPGGYQMEKTADRLWGLAQYFSNLSPQLTISIDNETGQPNDYVINLFPSPVIITDNAGDVVTVTDNLGAIVTVTGSGGGIVTFPPQAVAQTGFLIGLTISTQAADMALISLMVAPQLAYYRG